MSERSHESGSCQQFTEFTARDSSRIHAGNKYVEYEQNYYGPASTSWIPPTLKAALAFPEMTLRRDHIAREQTRTCEWFLETPEYKRWRDQACWSMNHGILWIKGKPGAGKSTLMKYAMKAHKISEDPGIIASFFFNARGHGLERSTEGLYRTLLHQLVDDNLRLQDEVEPEAREQYQKNGWPLQLLKELFHDAVLSFKNADHLTIYIDALDECDEDAIRDMLAIFEEIGDAAGPNLSVLLSSRHYPNVKVKHREEIVLDDLEGHRDDISQYVQRRLNLNSIEDRQDLAIDINRRSSGVFLWVVLVVAILNKSDDHGNIFDLREKLSGIPTDLQELFEDLLNRDEPQKNLLSIIQWTLFAEPRLYAIELFFAVKLSTGQLTAETMMSSWRYLSAQVLHDFVLTSSKGLLELKSNPHLTEHKGALEGDKITASTTGSCDFIHESVRQYFLNRGLQKLDPSLGNDVTAASHACLAQSCQQYVRIGAALLLGEEPGPTYTQLLVEFPHLHGYSRPSTSEVTKLYPCLQYVCDNGLFFHAEEAESGGLQQTDFCANFPLKQWRSLKDQRHSHYLEEEPGALLLVLAKRGCANLVQRELHRYLRITSLQPTGVDQIDARYAPIQAALRIAAAAGYVRIIRILLDGGVREVGSALALTAVNRHWKAMRTLLDYGAEKDMWNAQDIVNVTITVIRSCDEGAARMIAESGCLRNLSRTEIDSIFTKADKHANRNASFLNIYSSSLIQNISPLDRYKYFPWQRNHDNLIDILTRDLTTSTRPTSRSLIRLRSDWRSTSEASRTPD